MTCVEAKVEMNLRILLEILTTLSSTLQCLSEKDKENPQVLIREVNLLPPTVLTVNTIPNDTHMSVP